MGRQSQQANWLAWTAVWPAALAWLLNLGLASKAAAADESAATGAEAGGVVWLLKGSFFDKEHEYSPLLSRELCRQALLIAARDELGLQTRDESLREWEASKGPSEALWIDVKGMDASIRSGADGTGTVIWQGKLAADNQAIGFRIVKLSGQAEALSRGEWVEALRKQGFSGHPNAIRESALSPPHAEQLVGEMDELSQFAALRLTHAAIAADGESPQRLDLLVRAYANLGRLTSIQWSLQPKVFTARSLIYAYRMVKHYPKSRLALWDRAYAKAMAGVGAAALNDLAAAEKLSGEDQETAPAWVALIEPFCKYQSAKLAELTQKEPSQAGLAGVLRLLSLQYGQSQLAIITAGQQAQGFSPRCLLIQDIMCDNSGPGLANELVETEPNTFSQSLSNELETMPDFPGAVKDVIANIRARGGNDPYHLSRKEIWTALIQQGVPQKDKQEPSWAVLGRMIEETTFAHARRYAHWLACEQGVEAGGYVEGVRPLVEGHPYAAMMDVYGLWHSGTQKELVASWKDMDWSDLPSKACSAEYMVIASRSDQAFWHRLWLAVIYHTDATSCDLEQLLQTFRQLSFTKGGDDYWAELLRHVSPQSPWLVVLQIQDHWDKAQAQAAQWEKEQGDVPAVSGALARKYADLKRWADAERCWRRYIAVSPDYDGYLALANVYWDENLPDKWLQTMKKFLDDGQAYGLEDAQAQDRIANYLDGRGQFKEAIPYADAEAESGAGWALQTDGYAHALVGDWAVAFRLFRECEDHYDQSPFDRYSLCCVSGQGDLKQAAGELEQFITARNAGNLLTIDDMYGYVGLQLVNKNDANAQQMLQRMLKQYSDPRAALHLALISSRLGDAAGAEKALDQAVTLSPPDTPYARFAGALRKAMHGGGALNPRDVDFSLQLADENGELTISYLAAGYMLTHSQQSQATAYLRRCFDHPRLQRIESAPAAIDARNQGIDPWTCIVNSFKAAATQPVN